MLAFGRDLRDYGFPPDAVLEQERVHAALERGALVRPGGCQQVPIFGSGRPFYTGDLAEPLRSDNPSGAGLRAAARFQEAPAVDIQGVGGLAPDAQSIGVQVLAECPEGWTVVEAVVRVSQPSGSGQASFPLTCIGSPRLFGVTVLAGTGSFQLGEAQVSATVRIKRGKTARADDSATVPVQPTVGVELAESGQRVDGGQAVVLDVTVACPAGTTGLLSSLVVSQSRAIIASSMYTPICDGSRHTFTVRVEADSNPYQPGIAQAVTFAQIEWQGQVFYGIDGDGALELVGRFCFRIDGDTVGSINIGRSAGAATDRPRVRHAPAVAWRQASHEAP